MGTKTSIGVRAEVLNQTVTSHRVPVGTPFPASRDLRPISSTQLHCSLYKLHSLCWLCSRAVEVLIVFVICRISIRVHTARDASRCPTSDRLVFGLRMPGALPSFHHVILAWCLSTGRILYRSSLHGSIPYICFCVLYYEWGRRGMHIGYW
jgi:hypothetical protein